MKYLHNLFINYYTDKNWDRQSELDLCVAKNLKISGFNNLIIICNEIDWRIFKTKFPTEDVLAIIIPDRPTFSDFFELINIFMSKNNLNYISNLDIFFPNETLNAVGSYFNSTVTNRCLALSRWDHIEGKTQPVHLNNSESQDTWIFNGGIKYDKQACRIKLGINGCDNKIAFLLDKAGYEVLNPSLSLKTIHQHESGVRNNINKAGAIEFIHPPYKFIEPTL